MRLRALAKVTHPVALWLRLLLALAVLQLAACASEPPPVPPAELGPTSSEVSVLRLWSAKVGEGARGRFEPLVTADQIILANRRGKLTSLGLDTGMRQWSTNLDVSLNSGIGGTDDLLYVSDVDGVVHAVESDSGEVRWTAKASSEILVPVAAGYGVAVVRSTDGRVVVLEAADGSERWSVSNPPPALTLNGYSRPLLLDGGVLVGLDDGRLLALNLASGKPIWETVISVPTGRSEVERLVDIDADLLVDDAGIYLANYQGKAARIEPAKGQIVWSVPLSAGAGIALTSDSLVVVDDSDTVHLLDKETGHILWSNDTMPGRRLTAPGITSTGDIIVGDVEGYLHVLDFDTGRSVGRTRLGKEPIRARPIARDDTVYVQTTDGIVAAYRFAR